MTSLPEFPIMTFEAEKEMLALLAEFDAEGSADASGSAESTPVSQFACSAESTPVSQFCGETSPEFASAPAFCIEASSASEDSESTLVPHFRGEAAPQECSVAEVADVSVHRLARAVVREVLSAVSLRLETTGEDSSSDGSDDFVFFDPAIHVVPDDEPTQVSSDALSQASGDSERSGIRVLDHIQDKLVKVSDSAHRNMGRVAEKVQSNMQFVATKSKLVSQTARAKSEQFQEVLPHLIDMPSPKKMSQAAAAHSDLMQKNVQIVKLKTNELATDTVQSVKESEVVKNLKDATHAMCATVSDKAHTSFDILKEKAQSPKAVSHAAVASFGIMQKNVQNAKLKTNEIAADTMGFVKEKSELVKDATHAVYVTVSDKAQTGSDLVKEKAEIVREKAEIACGTAQAVSTTVSEKAHTSFEMVKGKAEVARGTAHTVSMAVSEKAKETARAMRDGNYLQYMQFLPTPISVSATHVIRQRGGA